jgi:hypothetical protein
MRNTQAKLLRRLTRRASPLSSTPKEIRIVYRGVKELYLSKPGPRREAFMRKLVTDAYEQAVKMAAQDSA